MAVADRIGDGGIVTLPREAGNVDAPVFEVNDDWLQGAAPAQQQAAMWRRFATRYEEPQLAAPPDGQGGFLYTTGGPYQADQVLHRRFDGKVPPEVIDELVALLRSEVGNEWAPKPMDRSGG